MEPIRTPTRPFSIITIDFVLALPTVEACSPWKLDSFDLFDCMMTVMCKFSEKSILLPGHSTYNTASDWATTFFLFLLLLDWGLPIGIISDRNRNFIGDFWRTIWEKSV
jgi:hypothetical protein